MAQKPLPTLDHSNLLAKQLLQAIADPGNSPNPDNPKGERTVSEWSRDAVMETLLQGGHVVPGVPPAAQLLADAHSFAEQLVLTKLVARVFKVFLISGVATEETPAILQWMRDYIDGTVPGHGPLGEPMAWPNMLFGMVKLLREWGFVPAKYTEDGPQYVARAPQAQGTPSGEVN